MTCQPLIIKSSDSSFPVWNALLDLSVRPEACRKSSDEEALLKFCPLDGCSVFCRHSRKDVRQRKLLLKTSCRPCRIGLIFLIKDEPMVDRLECRLYRLVAVLLATSFIAGLLSDGPQKAFADFLSIQISGARLINDFTSIGIGGALLNASSVAAIGLLLVRFADVRFGSPTLAAVFTMWGFGFFGKTPLNILPIMAGVWMVSVLIRKTLGSYSLVALFGTALGPLVTFIIFETSMPLPFSIPVGILCGIVTGMLLPAIASALLQFHQGFVN